MNVLFNVRFVKINLSYQHFFNYMFGLPPTLDLMSYINDGRTEIIKNFPVLHILKKNAVFLIFN